MHMTFNTIQYHSTDTTLPLHKLMPGNETDALDYGKNYGKYFQYLPLDRVII